MKRRLAMLLAFSLTFTMLPMSYASAAEATETVEVQTEQETAEAVIASEDATEAADIGQTTTTVTEEAAVVDAAEADTTVAPAETEAAAPANEATTESVETNPVVTEDESAAAATTEAVVEVPETAETISSETAAAEEPAIAEEVAETEAVSEAKASIKYANQFVVSAKTGRTFYFGADGNKVTGWKTIDGKKFYFYPEGSGKFVGQMATGKVKIGKYYFIFADKKNFPSRKPGEMLQGFKKYNGKVYYLADYRYPACKTAGAMLTGWKTIQKRKYYFGTDGVRRTGWQTIGNYKYYFAEYKMDKAYTGRMVTGLTKIDGKYYFFGRTGRMFTGWVMYNNIRGYYTSSGAAGKTGWKQKGDEWFYLGENGIAKTGPLTLNASSIYYLDRRKHGAMVVGPTKLPDGKIVFYDSEGRKATTAGWKGYGEYYYYTNKSGRCLVNTTVDGIKLDELGRTKMSTMDMKAQGYSSNTNYLVLCDKSTYTVCIYKGSKGNWQRIKGPWNCTHGGSRTPAYTSDGQEKYITFTGRLTKRSATWGWGDFEYTSAAFCMNLSSGNFFHSVLFNKGSRSNPYNLTPVDGNLRTNWSHGCIRLALPNAEWVWDNIPAGTRAVVYNS